MGKHNPKISIIIPSFNSGKYLPFTLKSIADQNYSNYEVIVIDGQSTDDTVEVVKKNEAVVTVFISEKDEGQSDAVNKGLSHASGDFVLWQNADDVFFPGAFSAFIDAHNADDSYDVYFGDIALLGEDGHELWRRYFTDIDPLIANYHGLVCNNQAAFIRRDVIDRHGFLDKSFHYAMDREFFLRLYHRRVKFKHFDYVVSGFRHQPDSKTESPENIEKWANEHRRIAQKYGLLLPGSVFDRLLEKFASVDKALRMLFVSPNRFISTMKRTVIGGDKKPY
jgi:glycosyltransferase involved in cell wall biosynthesis